MALSLAAGCAGLLLAGGCQSASQSDLIARERRLQEDKIYALQDYLAEYQQLLCQYRAENAALREQLGADGDGSTLDAAGPRMRNGPPSTPSRPRSRTETPPLPDLEVPTLDVPRLDGQSNPDGASTSTPTQGPSPIQLASHDEVATAAEPPQRVWLSGQIVANDAGGPRIMVDVAALSDAGRSTAFAGPVSLMVLAPQGDGPPRNLARWDFTPHEALAAAVDAPDPHAMRFRLELPPDAAIGQPAELWVRLVREDGGKLLANVPLDLARPHSFASAPFETPPATVAVDAPSTPPLDTDLGHPPFTFPLLGAAADGWTIARPGESAAATTAASQSTNQWRAATEPLPIVVAASPAARPAPSAPPTADAADQQAPAVSVSESAPHGAPSWSPERATGLAASTDSRDPHTDATSSALLGWSPTR